MEIIRNRGLSKELTQILPQLEIVHYCNGAATICKLREGDDRECVQIITKGQIVGFASSYVGDHCETTEIYPQPKGCKECPLYKASQSHQSTLS